MPTPEAAKLSDNSRAVVSQHAEEGKDQEIFRSTAFVVMCVSCACPVFTLHLAPKLAVPYDCEVCHRVHEYILLMECQNCGRKSSAECSAKMAAEKLMAQGLRETN